MYLYYLMHFLSIHLEKKKKKTCCVITWEINATYEGIYIILWLFLGKNESILQARLYCT